MFESCGCGHSRRMVRLVKGFSKRSRKTEQRSGKERRTGEEKGRGQSRLDVGAEFTVRRAHGVKSRQRKIPVQLRPGTVKRAYRPRWNG